MVQFKDVFSAHQKRGDKLVPRPKGTIRLYNMSLCPYGHRVLLVAEALGVELEIINVDLMCPPEWMYAKGISGVPVLETDSETISESLDICSHLFRTYSSRKGKGADEKQWEDRQLAQKFQEVIKYIFPLFFKIFDDKEAGKLLPKLTQELVEYDNILTTRGSSYFAGEQPGFLDYVLWPFVERLGIMKHLFPSAPFKMSEAKEKIPRFVEWKARMQSHPVVQAFFLDSVKHTRYIKNRRDYSQGKVSSIDYDFVHEK